MQLLFLALNQLFRGALHQQKKTHRYRSGIYLSQTISKQAKHLLSHKEILATQGRNKTNHHSIINDLKIGEALFSWAADQPQFGKFLCCSILQEGLIDWRKQTYTGYSTFFLPAHPQGYFPFVWNFKKYHLTYATHWIYKLGFKPQEYHKSLYFNGHKLPDVVEARKKYIQDFTMYRKQSQIYGGKNLDVSVPVDPELSGTPKRRSWYSMMNQPYILKKSLGLLGLPGTQEIHTKSSGRLIHISNFILETTGCLKLSDNQFLWSQTCIGIKPESADCVLWALAGTHICPETIVYVSRTPHL